MAEFFAMGGYGGYIWFCYGLSALVIGGLIFLRLRRLRNLRKK